MLSIRLFRTGKRNQPFFKVVVTDIRKSSTRGRFVEQVGFYNPLTKEKNLNIDRVKHWLSVGVKPSPTVHNMLISEKVIEGKKIPKHKIIKKVDVSSEAQGAKEGEKPAEEPKPTGAAVGETNKPAKSQVEPAKEIVEESKPEAPVVVTETKEKPAEPETKTEENIENAVA